MFNRMIDGLEKEDRKKITEAIEAIEQVANKIRINALNGKSRIPAYWDGVFVSKMQQAADLLKSEVVVRSRLNANETDT